MNTRMNTRYGVMSMIIVLLLALAACSSQPAVDGTQKQDASAASAAPADGAAAPTAPAAAASAPAAAPVAPAADVAAPVNTTVKSSPRPAAKTVDVLIKDSSFQPVSITINEGDTVTWTNQDSTPHTIKLTQGESDELGKGGTFSKIFRQNDTYDYNCGIHPSMQGVVVVE